MQKLISAWDEVSKRINRARHVLLCADFDGTIAPLKPRPEEARLSGSMRRLLNKIAQKKNFSVAIISGRALKDVKEKVGGKGMIYAGNHGLEIAYSKKTFIYPPAKKYIPVISKIALQLSSKLAPFPNAVLEHKRLSLSLHYRLVSPQQLKKLRKVFLQVVRPYSAAQHVKLTFGKKVWEVRPPIDWDKGRALIWLNRRLNKPLTIFMGDDLTDEDGFRAVEKLKGFSILVGRRKKTAARYSLKNTKETQEFLERICAG